MRHRTSPRLPGRALALACVLLSPAAAHAQSPAAPEIRIGGRVHTQYSTSSVDSAAPAQWRLRRVRLEAHVRISEVVSGKVQPDFAGDRVSLKDAYLQLDLGPALRVLAGQTHRPFSALTRTSSLRMPAVEKGAVIRGVDALDEQNLVQELGYSGHDVGVQLGGALPGLRLPLRYELALTQGPAASRAGRGSRGQVVGRLTADLARDLHIGAAWSRRDFAAPGEAPSRRGHALLLDAEYGAHGGGLHLHGEVVRGALDPHRGRDFRGAAVWAGYQTGALSSTLSGLEPVLRVSRGRVDEGAGEGGVLLTPGVNVYFGGLNRLMLNLDVWRPEGGGTPAHSWKAMFQLAF